MRIAVDAHRILCEPRTSGALYLQTLLEEWHKMPDCPSIDLLLPSGSARFLDADAFPVDERMRLVRSDRRIDPTESLRMQVLWQQSEITRLVRRCRPDVYFSPFHLTPQLPFRQTIVTTIHDVCFLTEQRCSRGYLIHAAQTLSACVRASRLICVSNFTRGMLQRWSPAAAAKACVAPNGLDRPTLDPGPALRLLHDCHPSLRSRRYLMWIGKPGRRKNIGMVFDIYGAHAATEPDFHYVVVVPEVDRPEMRELGMRHRLGDRLVVLSAVDEMRRDALYRHAAALVFPSRCEGFGYPVLEAMIQGCPPISFHDSPARELVGDIVPLAAEATASAVLGEVTAFLRLPEEAKEESSRRLRDRARIFSSRRMAELTLNAIVGA
jgi:glycosyltransferase involved in cell wall biosynthesis